MNKIEHIGIAVSNLEAAGNLYEKLLSTTIYKYEDVASEQVKTAFLQCGPNKVELLEATSPDSPIAKFITKKGEGFNHVAFEVDDIKAEMERLKNEGFILLSNEPKLGADNKLVCFVHPKSSGGVLVELCQEAAFPRKTKQSELNLDEQINLFEFRRKLIIPDDLKAYFMLSENEIDNYNQDMFTFYKFDEFKSLKAEVGDYGGLPNYKRVVNTLPFAKNCFVFADYFLRIHVYVIRLNENASNVNEIYAIMGDDYKLVANCFSEFIDIYNDDFGKVLI